MAGMTDQLNSVEANLGREAMLDYATRTLSVYRVCARPQRNGRKHFAHDEKFRSHFVTSMWQLRKLLRASK